MDRYKTMVTLPHLEDPVCFTVFNKMINSVNREYSYCLFFYTFIQYRYTKLASFNPAVHLTGYFFHNSLLLSIAHINPENCFEDVKQKFHDARKFYIESEGNGNDNEKPFIAAEELILVKIFNVGNLNDVENSPSFITDFSELHNWISSEDEARIYSQEKDIPILTPPNNEKIIRLHPQKALHYLFNDSLVLHN